MEIGAIYKGNNNCEFIVWGTLLNDVKLHTLSPDDKVYQMKKDDNGYWSVNLDNIPVGTKYMYIINEGNERPDPASRYQPDGVHGPSAVVDYKALTKSDCKSWSGMDIDKYIMYELHIGTFSEEGTFSGAVKKIPHLMELGVTNVEILPVAQFPGDRNWGYDGVYPYGVQNSYGTVYDFKNMIDEFHKAGIAVTLDVVYNHLGPEGNYFYEYGPYFSDRYKTPWGGAINFDSAYSPGVRNYFVENVIYWLKYFDIDSLRLDAVHAIYDFGAEHILKEMQLAVESLSKQKKKEHYLIAESDLNNSIVIDGREKNGYELAAQWVDDFHHSLHTLLTEELNGFYMDFGKPEHLIKSYKEGYTHSGEYSHFRKRFHGNSSKNNRADQFVVFSQNHDMTGNRMLGERLCHLISFEGAKLAAAAYLLSPFIPMIFMGEEYAEDAPFYYFVSHTDKDLAKAVSEGRKVEFADFVGDHEPPDPNSEDTFNMSKLRWNDLNKDKHKVIFEFYKTLINFRKTNPVLNHLSKSDIKCEEVEDKCIYLKRKFNNESVIIIMNFNKKNIKIKLYERGIWKKQLDSSAKKWNGAGEVLPEGFTDSFENEIRGESVAVYIKS